MRLIGTPVLSWRRAGMLAMHVATDRSKATYRLMAGDAADWRLLEVMASRMVNAAEYGNYLAYQMNKDKKAPDWPAPQPLFPPWVQPVDDTEPVTPGPIGERTAPGRRRIGNARMSIDEAKKWLGW